MKYLPYIAGFLIISCTHPAPQHQQDPYAHIEDAQVKTILQSAIKYAGGILV